MINKQSKNILLIQCTIYNFSLNQITLIGYDLLSNRLHMHFISNVTLLHSLLECLRDSFITFVKLKNRTWNIKKCKNTEELKKCFDNMSII
jgi:hypothetical protein